MKAWTHILATLSGGTGMWLLAGLWHKVILPGFYTAQTHATHEGTGIIFAAYMVLAGLMSYLYPLWYRGGRPAAEGLKFGMLMGVLWVFPHELAMAGAHGDSIAYVFKNASWHVFEQGAGGIVMALVHARRSPARI